MNTKTLTLALVALASSAVVSASYAGGHSPAGGAAPVGMNANPTVAADRAAIKADMTQLRADRQAGNTTAMAADQAKLKSDGAQLQADRAAVKAAVDNSATVKADRAQLQADRATLAYDHKAGATAQVISADKAKVQADRSQLRHDINAVVAQPVK